MNALCISIQVKSYRGNVEAQFARSSSRVQLLYRRDRYFSMHNVRLKDLYPMIEWYKQHRREFFLVMSDRESSNSGGGGSQSHDSGSSVSSSVTVQRTKVRDLRENMVANVLCRVRELKPAESAAMDAHLVHQTYNPQRVVEATDFDGVLLHELVMQDNPKDWMVVNLWDQHAETKFVTRLLAHPGLVEIRGVVVSLNALSNRLLANTTPQTQICFIDTISVMADRDVQDIEKSFGNESRAARQSTVRTSLDELENQCSDGLVLVDNLRIERILLGKHFGSSSRVQPQFTQLLVESYCSVCSDVLPEVEPNVIPPQYGPCRKRCRAPKGKKERLWRYRRFQIVLCDARNQRMQLEVENNALLELLGNIKAEMLIHAHIGGNSPPFNAKSAVAALLNALVSDGAQTFRAEIRVTRLASQSGGESQRFQSIGSSQDTQQNQQRTELTLASLVASPSQHLVI